MNKKRVSVDKVIAEAVVMAKKVGLHGITMRGLARRLDCSVMPIYDAFDSKEILIEAIYNTIIQENIKYDSYFSRNREVLLYGIRSPILYRDIQEYGSKSDEFLQLYKETIELMKFEPRLKVLDAKVYESLHFDISIYITGLAGQSWNKIYDIPDYESHCLKILNDFTEVLILGYEKGVEESNIMR